MFSRWLPPMISSIPDKQVNRGDCFPVVVQAHVKRL